MNILIYGNGFLGNRIAAYTGGTIEKSRINRPEDLEQGPLPDIIVNAAGKTGRPNVDWCESHKDETYFANVTLTKLLAEHAKRHNIKLVHLSSGCIYEGDNDGRGWSEEDAPNFERSFYSHTKAEAERLLASYDNTLIVRPRMPITSVPTERNLINKLLAYNEVIVVPNSVTIIEDFLPSLGGLIASGKTGIYNLVNPEPVTHKEILELYETYAGTTLGKTYIEANVLKVAAPRSNTILRTDKLEAAGFPMAHTRASLERVLKEYVANLNAGGDQN